MTSQPFVEMDDTMVESPTDVTTKVKEQSKKGILINELKIDKTNEKQFLYIQHGVNYVVEKVDIITPQGKIEHPETIVVIYPIKWVLNINFFSNRHTLLPKSFDALCENRRSSRRRVCLFCFYSHITSTENTARRSPRITGHLYHK